MVVSLTDRGNMLPVADKLTIDTATEAYCEVQLFLVTTLQEQRVVTDYHALRFKI